MDSLERESLLLIHDDPPPPSVLSTAQQNLFLEEKLSAKRSGQQPATNSLRRQKLSLTNLSRDSGE